ncbi:hypothetical protein NMG60_11014193 [Bertholletia excelsa]
MTSTVIFPVHNFLCVPNNSPRCHRKESLAPLSSQYLAYKSLLRLKKQPLLSIIQSKKLKAQKFRAIPVVSASQSKFLRVLQTAWKVSRDGIEAGAGLVPDAVPRPIARISVTLVAATLVLFVLKSVLSTAFFVLAMMGLIYFTYLALNKDQGLKGGGRTTSTEESLEEARRIMEKYK